MAMQAARRANVRLPPEVNRILYIRNLPYKITAEEMYDIFGKYGAIRQIRVIVDDNTIPTPFQYYQKVEVRALCVKAHLCALPKYANKGTTSDTRGTAYVVYEDIFDAKNACDHLSGFNVCNRYLVVLYYNPNRQFKKSDTQKKQEELDKMKAKYGVNTEK